MLHDATHREISSHKFHVKVSPCNSALSVPSSSLLSVSSLILEKKKAQNCNAVVSAPDERYLVLLVAKAGE